MERNEDCSSANGCSKLPYFMIGLATGIGLTILLAPSSGVETRRRVGRTLQEGRDWVKTRTGEAHDSLRSRGADLRKRAVEVASVIGRSSTTPTEG